MDIKNNKVNKLKSKMHKLLWESYRGWNVWRRLVKKYKLQRNKKIAVIMLPNNEPENSYFALLYLDRFLSKNEYKGAILLVGEQLLCEASKLMCVNIWAVEYLSDIDRRALLQYYAVRLFDERFVVASLTEPNGRNGQLLVGKKGITVEEMVAIGVYKIIPYVQKKRPLYQGDNKKLEEFMRLGGNYENIRTSLVIQ